MTVLVCMNCGYKNDFGVMYSSSESHYCKKCGVSLDLQDRTMPTRSMPIQKGKSNKIKYCFYFVLGIVIIVIIVYVLNLVLPIVQTIMGFFK